MRISRTLLILALLGFGAMWRATFAQPAGQEVKWLRIGSLRSWISSVGSEIEIGRTGLAEQQLDGLIWPAQFPLQDHLVGKAFWIGTTNYFDRTLKNTVSAKVVCVGPRVADPITEVMPVSFKMIGRTYAPSVYVDDDVATDNAASDGVDETDPNLPCDRMVVSVLNSTIGITITRKVMAFSQQNHDNYYISEYTFKNTGLVDKAGTVEQKTLTGVIFFFEYRYAFGEEGYRYSPATPNQNIGWGRNAVLDVIGADPYVPGYDSVRAHFGWYGKHSQSPYDDVGLPSYWLSGDVHLTASQYAGGVTLHADKSPADKSDDLTQPATTAWMGADDAADAPQAVNQYDVTLMQRKYTVMTSGHPAQTQAQALGTAFADQFGTNPGGYSQTAGYGPYTLAFGDSIRIVIAEGIAGLSREKCYEVGKNWSANTGPFILPNGSAAVDRFDYKDKWVLTGIDSVKQMFRRARQNYQNSYVIPQAPPPPGSFSVQSGGDRVRLTWTDDARSWPGFAGYEVYRAFGRSDTFYTKIYSGGDVTFDDTSARRGFDYYYYVVSKDDGSNTGGIPLVSSKYYTMTNKPAQLRRPASTDPSAIRVVPNPYDSRAAQFGAYTPDRIAFFGLPGVCTIKIYTERGDLVKTLYHTNGSGDELWDQTTTYRQVIVSGLYIAVFESDKGTVVRKFIVIR